MPLKLLKFLKTKEYLVTINRWLLTVLFLVFSVSFANAQVIPPSADVPEPVQPPQQTILPIGGYSSDYGLYGGGFYQRISFSEQTLPFSSEFSFDFLLSTRGDLMSQMQYQRLQTFGKPIRSNLHIEGERRRQSGYFGIGNNTVFEESLFDDGFYDFDRRTFFLEYQARRQLTNKSYLGQIDTFGLVSFAYGDGVVRNEESLFNQERPQGFGSGWVNKLGVGFITDSRDSEYIPTEGVRHEIGISNSNRFLGSSYSLSTLNADFRHHTKLLPGVVLAHRLSLEHILGTAPYWDLAIIGNKFGLRGFHENRFRGNSSVLSMLELRSWLFSFWENQIGVGVQGFWDTGRVFTEQDSNRFFDDWKQSFGGGIAISLFDPSLIIRADIGISDESSRFYFGTGYIF